MIRAAIFRELDAAIAKLPPESPWVQPERNYRGGPPLLRRERIALDRETGRRPPARAKQNRHVLPQPERRLKYLLELGRIDQIRDEGLWLLPGAQQIGDLER